MMSNFKFSSPLTLIAAALLAAGCSGTNSPLAESGGVTPEPARNLPPSSTIGYYVSFNGGANGAAIRGIGDDFRTILQTVPGGQDQNVLFDKTGMGTLYVVGSVGGTSLNTLTNVAGRSAAYGASGFADTKATYAAITSAKGLTALPPKGGAATVAAAAMFAIADSSGANALHVVSKSVTGAATPVLTITAASLGGNAWDSAYDNVRDILYVAITSGAKAGSVAAYDNFLATTVPGAASVAPTRYITPGRILDNNVNSSGSLVGNGGGSTATPDDPSDDVSIKLSTNLHGIDVDTALDRLVVSDVGAKTLSTDAGFDTDGSLFEIYSASTAVDAAAAGAGSVAVWARATPPLRCYTGYTPNPPNPCSAASGRNPAQKTVVLTGSKTNLGNPVDVIFSGRDALVAEKANGGGFNLLRFENFESQTFTNGVVTSSDPNDPAKANDTIVAISNATINRNPTISVFGSAANGKLESITSAK